MFVVFYRWKYSLPYRFRYIENPWVYFQKIQFPKKKNNNNTCHLSHMGHPKRGCLTRCICTFICVLCVIGPHTPAHSRSIYTTKKQKSAALYKYVDRARLIYYFNFSPKSDTKKKYIHFKRICSFVRRGTYDRT